MSLEDYYRKIRELEEDKAKLRQSSLSAMGKRNAVVNALNSEERQNREAAGQNARAARKLGAAVDQYGAPWAYDGNGHPYGMNVPDLHAYLARRANMRTRVAIQRTLMRKDGNFGQTRRFRS